MLASSLLFVCFSFLSSLFSVWALPTRQSYKKLENKTVDAILEFFVTPLSNWLIHSFIHSFNSLNNLIPIFGWFVCCSQCVIRNAGTVSEKTRTRRTRKKKNQTKFRTERKKYWLNRPTRTNKSVSVHQNIIIRTRSVSDFGFGCQKGKCLRVCKHKTKQMCLFTISLCCRLVFFKSLSKESVAWLKWGLICYFLVAFLHLITRNHERENEPKKTVRRSCDDVDARLILFFDS